MASSPTAFPYRPVAQLLGSHGPIHAVAYSASPGTYILSGAADRVVRLYNPLPGGANPPSSAAPLPEGRLIQAYSGHSHEVLSLAVAADNARFASSGGDRAVFLWDVATATTLRRFGASADWGHSSRVNCVAFAGEADSLLASGGFDTTVRLWDCRGGGGRPVQTLSEARDSISALAVSGAELVAGSVDGRVRTYDVRMGRCVVDVLGASVTSLRLTRDGAALLVGSLDSSVRLLDRRSGACLRTYRADGRTNEALRVQSILGGGERFVVAGDEGGRRPDEPVADDGRVWAWDLLTGKVVATLGVPWGNPPAAGGPAAGEPRKKVVVGRDGREKERRNVVSCLAWRDDGWGAHFCVGASSGAVTVFGAAAS